MEHLMKLAVQAAKWEEGKVWGGGRGGGGGFRGGEI